MTDKSKEERYEEEKQGIYDFLARATGELQWIVDETNKLRTQGRLTPELEHGSAFAKISLMFFMEHGHAGRYKE